MTALLPDRELAALRAMIAVSQPDLLADLEHLVNLDSGRYTRDGVNLVAAWAADRLARLGGAVTRHADPAGRLGDTVEAVFTGEPGGGPLVGQRPGVLDVVGLDVVLHVGEIVTRELNQEPPAFVTKVRELVAAKKLGRKSGQGFYLWQDGKVVRTPGAATPPEDLVDRLILSVVNECVACLREQIVEDADLIDAGVIFGTGFAPFRGGPLTYARARGVDICIARLSSLEQRYGARFRPRGGAP